MIYTTRIQQALHFATHTHEIVQKQKRKGKDIPYITHPLGVGLILARAGASEDVIIAGILHDTIEDSVVENKVTRDVLAHAFGESVATLVSSVTEFQKELPWEIRKKEALEHVKTFSHDSLLLKSADILHNTGELLLDYDEHGEAVFVRFNAPKEKVLKNYLETITAIVGCWRESPLADDLIFVAERLRAMGV